MAEPFEFLAGKLDDELTFDAVVVGVAGVGGLAHAAMPVADDQVVFAIHAQGAQVLACEANHRRFRRDPYAHCAARPVLGRVADPGQGIGQ